MYKNAHINKHNSLSVLFSLLFISIGNNLAFLKPELRHTFLRNTKGPCIGKLPLMLSKVDFRLSVKFLK